MTSIQDALALAQKIGVEQAQLTAMLQGLVAAATTPSPPAIPWGPLGYMAPPILLDVFGSNVAGATISDLKQFNPSTPYGMSGSGWDTGMVHWDQQSHTMGANLAMAADHLELRPGTNGPAFILSHLELRLDPKVRYFVEVDCVAGRGTYAGGATSWPAPLWLFAGNSPGSVNVQSEADVVELMADQAFGSTKSPDGHYYNYFISTTHTAGGAIVEGPVATLASVDLTTTRHTYGAEIYITPDGHFGMDVWFDGAPRGPSMQKLQWKSSDPCLVIGWNPGKSTFPDAVMKLFSVKVRKKAA